MLYYFWMRDIKYENWDEFYEVWDDWSIRSSNFNHTGIRWKLKTSTTRDWYEYVFLMKWHKRRKLLVHRMVAISCIPNPQNKSTVNHIDSNKKNNNVENLERATQQENVAHNRRSWRKHSATFIENQRERFSGFNNPNCKYNKQTVRNILIDRSNWMIYKDISQKYWISVSQASNICNKYKNPELLD